RATEEARSRASSTLVRPRLPISRRPCYGASLTMLSLPRALAFASGAGLLVACNALTGADHPTTSMPGAGGASSTTSVTGSGARAAGGGGTGGAGPTMAAAPGVTISQIAMYQGVKRSLVGGSPSTSGVTVPIVAGRDALV